MSVQFKASAPGSLMLLGEYAVLNGKLALVCAVDKRIWVTLRPREDSIIEIYSERHGRYHTELANLTIEKPFQFVLGTLVQYQSKLRRGCDIEIVADFSDKVGFGSSAAVTVALLATLTQWLNIRITPMDLLRQGRNVVRLVQGMGSGADVAASVFGGIVSYQAQPFSAEKMSITHPITALYAGFKTPTVDAIKHVQQYFAAHPRLFREINNSIGQCAYEGKDVLRKGDWQRFGDMMNIQQGLMESLGVSTPLLRNMVHDLRESPNILGAKISGSGLGDCVIGLGYAAEYRYQGLKPGVEAIPVNMTLQGVQCEKI